MSHQESRSRGLRGIVQGASGLNKVAAAAAVLVALTGVAVGVNKAGVFNAGRVSLNDPHSGSASVSSAVTTGRKSGSTGVTPKVSASASASTSGSASVSTSVSAPPQVNPPLPLPVDELVGGLAAKASSVVTTATDIPTSQAMQVLELAKVKVLGTPSEALAWADKNGRDVLLVTREVVKNAAGVVVYVKAHVVVVAQVGDVAHVLENVTQKATSLDLVPSVMKVTDCNLDGIGEVTLGLVTGTLDKLSPVTFTVHELVNGADYTLTGRGLLQTVFDTLNPTQLLQLPGTLLSTVTNAVPLPVEWPTGTYLNALTAVNQYLH